MVVLWMTVGLKRVYSRQGELYIGVHPREQESRGKGMELFRDVGWLLYSLLQSPSVCQRKYPVHVKHQVTGSPPAVPKAGSVVVSK